jgi:polyketide biosynthesis 3-hydroxy-3-methylglutaryl-CoA synthase-like enzyme PksG
MRSSSVLPRTVRAGIEAIGVYAGPAFVDVDRLFDHRGLAPDRLKNVGMRKKSVALPCEDAVTYGCNAAKPMIDRLTPAEKARIELVITCTESPIDFGKSLSTYIHDLLGLAPHCRVLEAKQACYSGAAALQLAASVVASGFSPGAKALVICADVARATSRGTYAEPTQASGGVAMLVSDQPRILEIDPGAVGNHTYEVMDVCRPLSNFETGSPDLSLLSYLDCLDRCFTSYCERVEDVDIEKTFDYFAFHTPFAGMIKGAHRRLMRKFSPLKPEAIEADFVRRVVPSLHYCVDIGNIYAGTVFAALIGLIAQTAPGSASRVGMFSYGSGCCSEFFSGCVPAGAREEIARMDLGGALNRRWRLSMQEYENLLDSNEEWQMGVENKDIDLRGFEPIYEHSFAGRGICKLDRINNYHREYSWS